MTIIIEEGTRENPTKPLCGECGSPLTFTLHHDFMEACCCNRQYHIKVGNGVWNCCCCSDNPSIN